MKPITIISSDPAAEKLLRYITVELPKSNEKVVLLDAAQMERLPEFFGAKVILFSASADPAYLAAARETGAAGFWYLHPSAEALDRVLAGQPAFPEKPPVVMLGKARNDSLTQREMDVLRQLVGGRTDADIAAALRCSLSTVKHYLATLREKTGIPSRVELAVQARSSGLIDFL